MMNKDDLELKSNLSSDSSLDSDSLEQKRKHLAKSSLTPKSQPLHKKDVSGAIKILLRQAEVYLGQGQWKNAITSCQRVIAMDNHTAEAYKLCGEAFQGLGNVADAMGAYAEALAVQPNYPDVYVNMGQLYEELDDWDRAVDAYQAAIELHPGLVSAYRYLAKAWEQLDHPANHVDTIYQTLSLSPETFTADEHCEMGQWLLEQGQEQEAMECFQRAVALESTHEEAQKRLKRLLKKQENGQFSESAAPESDSSPVIQWPSQSSTDREESIEALVILARSYMQMGNTEKAIAYYEDALHLDARNMGIFRELIDLLNQSGKHEQALNLQYHILQSNGSQLSADECTLLGDQLFAQQQLAKAITCYRCALQANPESILAYQKLIHALKEEGDLREAAKAYLEFAQILNSKQKTSAAITILEDGVDWLHQQLSSL